MRTRRTATWLGGCIVVLSACSVSVQSGTPTADAEPVGVVAAADDEPESTTTAAPTPATDTAVSDPTASGPVGSDPAEPEPVATEPPATEPLATQPAPDPTVGEQPDEPPPPDVYDPVCTVLVEEFDSLASIAARLDDDTISVVTLRAENDMADADLTPGEYLDVCVDNGLDDITGAQRTGPDEEIVAFAVRQNVELQQRKLNRLFAGLGINELLVDGISGPVTRQRLCAARLALGLPVNLQDMEAGSDEEDMLFAADELPIPFTTSILSDRWILIDRTCQIMFIGESDERLVFVFPTSTGEAGYETRDQDRSAAFRFNPAVDNGGWHDSTDFPSAVDNPLNGNMYKPLYFDLGQAIHGANNVPRSPASKGCARLRVGDQNALVDWLDLEGATSSIWNANRLAVTVNVQGEYTG